MKRFFALYLLVLALPAFGQKAYQLPNLSTLNSNSLFITTVDASGGGTRHTSFGQLSNQLALVTASNAIQRVNGYGTNTTLRGDVAIEATTWMVTGDGNATFSILDAGALLTLGGDGINTWDDITNFFAMPAAGAVAITNTTDLPGVLVGGGSSFGVGTNLGTLATTAQLASATNNLDGLKVTVGTVADARIASSIARDSEVLDATNSLNTTLRADLAPKTNPVFVGPITGNGSGLTNVNPNNYHEVSVLQYGASTALTDNSTAFQNCFNYAAKATTTGSNVTVIIPPGQFNFTNTLLLTNCRSIVVRGAGMNNTTLYAKFAGPVIRTDGCWYSVFDSIQFAGDVAHAGAIFELDGDRAHDDVNFGVQGNTFRDCTFSGAGVVAYGLAVVPVGSSWGQGSENLFLNCHFRQCNVAGYWQTGYNALNNTFIGGNVQSCNAWGLLADFGTINVYSMGFQNGTQTQTNYDIGIGVNGSAFEASVVDGCRSESMRGVWGSETVVRGFTQIYGAATWAPTTAYSLSNVVVSIGVASNGYAYRCTVAGTSGGSEPTWITARTPVTVSATTITDGDVTWVRVDDVVMYAKELNNSTILYGTVSAKRMVGNYFSRPFFFDYSQYASFTSGNNGPIAFGNKIRSIYTAESTMSFNAYPTLDTESISATDIFQMGRAPVLWGFGSGGTSYQDVGFLRNDGAHYGAATANDKASYNVIGVVGSLGKARQFTNTGDTLRIVGGIGTNTLGGGPIELWTQTLGDTNATKRLTVGTNGNVTVGGVVNGTNGLAIGANAISTWDQVTNYFTMPAGGSATNAIANLDGFGTNTILRGDVAIDASAWSVAGDGSAEFNLLSATTLTGDGAAVTNISGQNITTGSISNGQIAASTLNSNRFDAATLAKLYEAVGGGGTTLSNVTDSGYTAVIRSNATVGGTLTVTGKQTNTAEVTINANSYLRNGAWWIADSAGGAGAYIAIANGNPASMRMGRNKMEFGANYGGVDAFINSLSAGNINFSTNGTFVGSVNATNGFTIGTNAITSWAGVTNYFTQSGGGTTYTNNTNGVSGTITGSGVSTNIYADDLTVDARAFGVVADGATDSALALRNAITNAAGTYKNTVLLPNGVIVINSRIYLPEGVTLRGVGKLGTVLRGNFTGSMIEMAKNSHLKELQLRNSSTPPLAGSKGVDFVASSSNWSIQDCEFFNLDASVWMDSTWVGVIQNCKFISGNAGLVFTNLHANEIQMIGGEISYMTNAVVIHCAGIKHQNIKFSGVAIQENYSNSFNMDGVASVESVENLTIEDCYFENGPIELNIKNVRGLVVQRNSLDGGPPGTTNMVLVGCESPSIINNHFGDAGTVAYRIDATTTDPYIAGNIYKTTTGFDRSQILALRPRIHEGSYHEEPEIGINGANVGRTNAISHYAGSVLKAGLTTNGVWFGNGAGLTNVSGVGGSDTPWTLNHDFAGFAASNIYVLRGRDSAGTDGEVHLATYSGNSSVILTNEGGMRLSGNVHIDGVLTADDGVNIAGTLTTPQLNATSGTITNLFLDGKSNAIVALNSEGAFTNATIGSGLSFSGNVLSGLTNVTETASLVTSTTNVLVKGNIVSTNSAVANTMLTLDGSRTTVGNVIEYKTNNASKFYVDSSGNVSGQSVYGIAAVTAYGTAYLGWASKSRFYNPVDGIISMTKDTSTIGMTGLSFGGGAAESLLYNSTNWPFLRVESSTNNVTLGVRKGTNTTEFADLMVGAALLPSKSNTPPATLSALVGGSQLWSDGTNLCVIIKNHATGTLTTNKLTMSAWP